MLKINKTLFQRVKMPFGVGLLMLGGVMLFGALTEIPEQTFAANPDTAMVSVNVESVLTLEVSPDADKGQVLSIVANSKDVNVGNFTAKVTSNQQYKISLSTKDETTALTNGTTNEKIPAIGSGALVTGGVSAWGVRTCVDDNAAYNCGTGSTALGANPYKTIGATNVPVEFYRSGIGGGTDVVTRFEVGIGVGSNLSSGEYTNNVLVTAAQI